MNARMNFEAAYAAMLKGYKIRRAGWLGYWYLNGVTGKLTIHLADGKEIVRGDIGQSIMNALASDWEVVDEAIPQ
jgi:hypothetical protein